MTEGIKPPTGTDDGDVRDSEVVVAKRKKPQLVEGEAGGNVESGDAGVDDAFKPKDTPRVEFDTNEDTAALKRTLRENEIRDEARYGWTVFSKNGVGEWYIRRKGKRGSNDKYEYEKVESGKSYELYRKDKGTKKEYVATANFDEIVREPQVGGWQEKVPGGQVAGAARQTPPAGPPLTPGHGPTHTPGGAAAAAQPQQPQQPQQPRVAAQGQTPGQPQQPQQPRQPQQPGQPQQPPQGQQGQNAVPPGPAAAPVQAQAPGAGAEPTPQQLQEQLRQLQEQLTRVQTESAQLTQREVDAARAQERQKLDVMLRAFRIYGADAEAVVRKTLESVTLHANPDTEQKKKENAESLRIMQHVLNRRGVLFNKGERITVATLPTQIQAIRNEQQLSFWQRFGIGKALTGAGVGGALGTAGSVGVYGTGILCASASFCALAAPVVMAGAAGGAVYAFIKRRLDRSNALGKGRTIFHKNPGTTAAVFGTIAGLGAGAAVPTGVPETSGAQALGLFVERVARGAQVGFGKMLYALARLRMPF